MIRLTFVTPDGVRNDIEAPAGANLMEVAVANGIDGILADCGGNLVCGTCHVVVPERFQALLPEQSKMERDMLECVPHPQPNTRLCCQIALHEALDGLELHVPEAQR
ncbi:2Fe-2S iron-sulfur cluster-binding protein [Pseudomonas aeruginosa]|uniref:2Fe-2S iron-sulfur cluster-binding protein n=1 Tax=Pseudomonas aeruginosa TaxID=287 RepID=UPI00053EFBC2|nr:2Fe-2S iron-sulfur cluster-binding protein [Pseudomonas aeruginosa]